MHAKSRLTTREFLQRVEVEATKRLDAARREMAKTDKKDESRMTELKREAEVMQNLMVYANVSLLCGGMK